MITIKTGVSAAHARDIIEWAFQFVRNSSLDFEPTEEQLNKIADYCVEGQDAWEAAAAIIESRKLRRRKISK